MLDLLGVRQALCSDPSLGPVGSRIVTNPISRLEMSSREIERVGYPHFMLKEIVYQKRSAMPCVACHRKDVLWEIRLAD